VSITLKRAAFEKVADRLVLALRSSCSSPCSVRRTST
jgi:hypothetical protein